MIFDGSGPENSPTMPGRNPEWLATDDQGEVVLSEEPVVTPLMRLRNTLLAPFVPEQLL